MSFRLISVPLNKRTEQEPRNNELRVDIVHGNIGISVDDGDNLKKKYNSGTERLKSDLESLKIRNKLMNENLIKISCGSENNVDNKDFNITKALEDKDILGSLQYIINQYSNFIKEVDDDGNVVLDESAFSYSEDLKKIVNKLYDMDGTYSYQYKFKKILEELYVKNLNNNEQETEDDDDTFSFLKLQKIILDYIPYLYDLECKIVKMERIIESVSNDLYGNIDKDMNSIKIELEDLKYNTKCRKFEKFNFNNDAEYYQTENNPEGYRMNLETGLNFENTSNTFEENFINSILDDNYDGDINLHRTDSYYNIPTNSAKTRMTGNYTISKQNYFDIPTDNIEFQLVYDPILKRPIYRYNTINMVSTNDYFDTNAPLLEYYLNDNNYILQNINFVKSGSIKYFNTKNIITERISNIKFIDLFRFSKNISDLSSNEFSDESYNFYFFPSIYNSGDIKPINRVEYYFNINNDNALNYDYFTGITVVDVGLEQIIDLSNLPITPTSQPENEEESEGEGEGGDEPTPDPPTPQPTFNHKIFWLLRNSYYIFNGDSVHDDYDYESNYKTGKANDRFELNNHNIMAHNYYSGIIINNGSLQGQSYDDFKTKFNAYISRLNSSLNGITSATKYPKINYTDILFDSHDNFAVVARLGNTGVDPSKLFIYEYDNQGNEFVLSNPTSDDPANHHQHIFDLAVTDYDLSTILDSVQNSTVYHVHSYSLDDSFTLTKALTDIVMYYNHPASVTPNISISKVLPNIT